MLKRKKASVQKLHNTLCIELKRKLPTSKLEDLKSFFRNNPFGAGELEGMKTLTDLWNALDSGGIIRPGSYNKLKNAFEHIGEKSYIAVITQFQERMKSEEGDIYAGWIIEKKVIHSKRDLLQRITMYKMLMEEGGAAGVVFTNAATGLVRKEGGQIRVWDGSASLEFPPNVIIDEKLTFWVFRPSPQTPNGIEQLYCEPDGIMKCSLPVALGPTDVKFNDPVLLTLRDFSLPETTNGAAERMRVFRKANNSDEGLHHKWENVGSCFCDTDSQTARVALTSFSSYILGVPVSDSTRLVNVDIIVQTNDCTSDKENIKVFFIVNDFSYIEEFIEHNRITVAGEICLYLAADSDVTVTWRRHVKGSPKHTVMEARLPKQCIQNLAEMAVFLEIDSPAAESSDELYNSNAYDDVIILEQNDKKLLELPFDRNDASSSGGEEMMSMLNAELCIHIDRCITLKHFKMLKNFLRGAHGISDVRAIDQSESCSDIIDLLMRNRYIRIGEPDGYQLLIEALLIINEVYLADVVKKYQADIANAGNPKPAGAHAASGTASQPANTPGGSTRVAQRVSSEGGLTSNLRIHTQGNVTIGLPPK